MERQTAAQEQDMELKKTARPFGASRRHLKLGDNLYVK